MEMGREARLLLRPGMARLKGLDTLRVVIESRLEMKDVVTVRRGFLGEDIVMMVIRKSYAALYTHGHYRWHTIRIPRFQGNFHLCVTALV
jgi:hypothetical protein